MYHYIPTRMAKLSKTENTKCWRECGTTGALISQQWEYMLVQLLGHSYESTTRANYIPTLLPSSYISRCRRSKRNKYSSPKKACIRNVHRGKKKKSKTGGGDGEGN